ncbi:MAG: DUF4249 domain-containing protein [Flavobacteriales bacterium]|nr:DUF4249 domain-containing protein [Flavobacteriales bacterium]
MRTSIFIILAICISFASCEKVIDIPLDEAEQRIVVEGKMKDNEGDNYILLSKTGSVYDDSGFEKISGASVTVNDGTTTYTFPENELVAGRYELESFTTQPNKTYTLTVDLGDGQVLSSTSVTNDKPTIDELYFEPQKNFFADFDPTQPDTVYQVFYNFSDNGAQENYYRINAWINGERDETYYIFDDRLFNGENNIAPLWGAVIEAGDTVSVELVSSDEAYYTYLFTLANSSDGGPFSATPANPVSNIDGDAIGYFAAMTTDTMTIIIPE